MSAVFKAGDRVEVIEPATGSFNNHYFRAGNTGTVENIVEEDTVRVRFDDQAGVRPSTSRLWLVKSDSLRHITPTHGGAPIGYLRVNEWGEFEGVNWNRPRTIRNGQPIFEMRIVFGRLLENPLFVSAQATHREALRCVLTEFANKG